MRYLRFSFLAYCHEVESKLKYGLDDAIGKDNAPVKITGADLHLFKVEFCLQYIAGVATDEYPELTRFYSQYSVAVIIA